jgi:hypothetical protein
MREAAEVARCALPPGHWQIGQYVEGHGAVLKSLGRFDEAEPLLREALGLMRESFSDSDPRVVAIADRLHDLYTATGDAAQAAEMSALVGGGAE